MSNNVDLLEKFMAKELNSFIEDSASPEQRAALRSIVKDRGSAATSDKTKSASHPDAKRIERGTNKGLSNPELSNMKNIAKKVFKEDFDFFEESKPKTASAKVEPAGPKKVDTKPAEVASAKVAAGKPPITPVKNNVGKPKPPEATPSKDTPIFDYEDIKAAAEPKVRKNAKATAEPKAKETKPAENKPAEEPKAAKSSKSKGASKFAASFDAWKNRDKEAEKKQANQTKGVAKFKDTFKKWRENNPKKEEPAKEVKSKGETLASVVPSKSSSVSGETHGALGKGYSYTKKPNNQNVAKKEPRDYDTPTVLRRGSSEGKYGTSKDYENPKGMFTKTSSDSEEPAAKTRSDDKVKTSPNKREEPSNKNLHRPAQTTKFKSDHYIDKTSKVKKIFKGAVNLGKNALSKMTTGHNKSYELKGGKGY